MRNDALDGLAGCHVRKSDEVDAVVFAYLVVVRRVLECEREQALLLQVGLVDAGEAARYDRRAAKQSRRQCCVFAAAAFAIVVVADHDPLDSLRLVVARDRGNCPAFLVADDILAGAGVAGVSVRRAHEHIVAELVQVPAIAQPGTGRRNVIGRSLALRLHQDGHIGEVVAVPRGPGLHKLDALAVRRNREIDAAAVFRRRFIDGRAACEILAWHFRSGRGRLEHELVALAIRQRVGERVEGQAAGNRHRRDDFGTADEVHRGGCAIVAAREVAVVRSYDCIRFGVRLIRTPPLPDAGTARIGEYRGVNVEQRGHLPVALDCGAHLLGAGRYHERHCGRYACRLRLLGDIGCAAHVFVGRVRATAD